jgi:hypothetical protein
MGLFAWDRYKFPTLSARSNSPVVFLASLVQRIHGVLKLFHLPEVARIRLSQRRGHLGDPDPLGIGF